MRVPSDLPRQRRDRLGPRGRVGLVVLAVALFVLLTSLRGIAGFYTDLLWFDSLGFRGVFTGVLGAKISLTVLFSLVFFALLWLNLFIGDRLAPRFRPAGPEEEVIERYHELIGHRTGLVRIGVSAVFALIAGAGVGSQWRDWILFTNAQEFGVKDAQFKTDVGFYVFRLPFLSFLVDWAFASIVIILIVVAVAHYLNGGIRLQGAAQRVTPQVKAHLSVLLAALAIVKAAGYWLQRFELTFSTRGTVDGATYTDVKAQLPAIQLLMLISVAAVVLLIVNIWRRGWVLPALAVGLWAFVAIVVGSIIPAFIQRFQVEPAESTREAPYIQRNITATREAYGLADVASQSFAAGDDLDAGDLQANATTVRNIRLWDPSEMREAFSSLQGIKPQYAITDVDVDRYVIDGELTQVEIGARDLNTDGVPQKSWEAQHLTYTHGHGVVMAAANAKDEDGRPSLLARDIPVKSEGDLEIEQASLYLGEDLGGYVITDTNRPEIDYETSSGRTQQTTYDGKDGVGIGSYVRRIAFALRFGDFNPLISSNIRSDSKILFQRDVSERVRTLAPFLSWDHDPYPVIVDGRISYIIDGYTTTSRYPYAERVDQEGLADDSGLKHSFNYVRNSVKAVIDAYDGTTTFYVVDDEDPIIAAYREAFPKLFSDQDEMPDGIRDHLRFPEDMFIVQTNMWGRYHLSNADDFYNNSGTWAVAQDPEEASTVTTATTDGVGGQTTTTSSRRVKRMEPYYLLTQLPGDTEPSFLILRPFVPVSEDDSQRLLTAFMVAKSDPGSYGELTTFVMPAGSQVDGPLQAAQNMKQDDRVSQTQSLLDGQGSKVSYGSLVIVPIEESLLYVRSMYVTAEGTDRPIPEVRKVIASFDGDVAIADTLQGALALLFGDAPPTLEETPTEGGEPTEPSDEADIDLLLEQAAQAFDEADRALREGDLATYQEKVKEAQDKVAEARRASGQSTDSTTTTTTTTTELPDA